VKWLKQELARGLAAAHGDVDPRPAGVVEFVLL
jgi:hypothetical protein